MQMYMSKPRLAVVRAAWANRPSSSVSGALFFATDAGASGTLFLADGTRWRALNGEATLKLLGADSSNIANTETAVLQTQMPVDLWQVGDVLRVYFGLSKSGATDNANAVIRIGTAGSSADTAILTLNTQLAAANLTGGYTFDFKLASATTVQRIAAILASGAYEGSSNGAYPAAVAISSAAENALYVSVGISSSGVTDTVKMTSGGIQLLTP